MPFVRRGLSGPTGSGNYYSNIDFVVIAHRNFMFYVWKVILLLFFLVASSWMPLWQSPLEFADRFNETLTLLLATVAFLFVVNDSLPRVSYLTILDKVRRDRARWVMNPPRDCRVYRKYRKSLNQSL